MACTDPIFSCDPKNLQSHSCATRNECTKAALHCAELVAIAAKQALLRTGPAKNGWHILGRWTKHLVSHHPQQHCAGSACYRNIFGTLRIVRRHGSAFSPAHYTPADQRSRVVGHPPAMLTRLRRPRETAMFWLRTILGCCLHERGRLSEWAAGEKNALDYSAEECGTSCIARKSQSFDSN